MKKLLLASVAATSLTAASMAIAGGPDQINVPTPNGGLYLGAAIGVAALDMPSDLLTSSANAVSQSQEENWGFSARLNAGYLVDITNKMLLGVELGTSYLPETKYKFATATNPDSNVKYDAYTVDMLGVAKYLLKDDFNVFAKFGVAYVNQEAKTTLGDGVTAGVTTKDHTSKILPEVALGAGYDLTPVIEMNVTYSHIFGDSFNQAASESAISNAVTSSNSVLVGASYKLDM